MGGSLAQGTLSIIKISSISHWVICLFVEGNEVIWTDYAKSFLYALSHVYVLTTLGGFSLVAQWDLRGGWLTCSSLHPLSWASAWWLPSCKFWALLQSVAKRIESRLVVIMPASWTPWGVFYVLLWSCIYQVCFAVPFSFTLVPALLSGAYCCPWDYHCPSHLCSILQKRQQPVCPVLWLGNL